MSKEFHYKAVSKNGEVVGGFKTAADEVELNKNLQAEGLRLISVEPTSSWSWRVIWTKVVNFGTISTHDKIIVYRNLSAMIKAGLSLSRALSVMCRQAKNKKLQKILKLINEEIKKGSSLSDALRGFDKVFTPLMVSMVRAGEESGNLVESLDVTAEQMVKSYTLRKKIKGAMIYPGVIISAMILVGFFMLVYIVPTLTSTFADLSVELPASTQFIISFSSLLQNNTTGILVLLLVLILIIIFGSRTEKGKRYFYWFVLHIPGISTIIKEINSARTTRTLSSLLSAGVPFVKSLQITAEVIQNVYYKEVILKAEKNIQLGLPVSKIFAEAEHLFPTFVGEMMSVGEETGELSDMLLEIATFYENEVDQKTKNISTIIEPVLMIIVGAAVGFFAISMISPMYSLVENI